MPKLTIITINLNNKEGLQKTMDSVLGQIFSDFEYIIVDGGSTDGSIDVIKGNADKLAFWASEPDNGIYNAMNKGILKASGEYLLFLNSGDCLAKNNVLTIIFTNNQESFDFISGDLAHIYPDGKVSISKMPERITAAHLYSSFLSHPSTFIKKEVLIKHGMYDESYKIAGDHAFFVKAFLLDSVSYTHKNVVVTNYTMDGISSIPGSIDQLEVERDRAFKEQLHHEYYRLIVEYNKLHKLSNVIYRIYIKFGLDRIISLLRRIKKLF